MTRFSASVEARLDRYAEFDAVNHRYLSWQLEQFRGSIGSRVLEVGCGVGGVMAMLGEREFICGIEIEPDVLDYVRRRFADRQRYQFRDYPFGALTRTQRDELRSMRFDTIVSFNVLEHIEEDVAALVDMREILESGAALLLLVPAHPSLYGDYDRLDGHYRRYSKRMLRQALHEAELKPTSLRYFNMPGAIGWWLTYKVLRRSVHGQGDLRLMNAILPATRLIERTISPPFGLSLLATVRR